MLTKQTKENLTYKPIAKTFANVDENNISIKDICKKISEIWNYKIPATWLIEKCGWKGKRIGNVGTYEKQALILTKYDKASGNEILKFASLIQKSLVKKFGIQIENEVNVV